LFFFVVVDVGRGAGSGIPARCEELVGAGAAGAGPACVDLLAVEGGALWAGRFRVERAVVGVVCVPAPAGRG
jgi:hypothetical protein